MRRTSSGFAQVLPVLAIMILASLLAPAAEAASVSFSGTVTYSGSHAADTLYVAVIDTNNVQDVNFLAMEAYPLATTQFNQAFSLTFDNAAANGPLIVAAALDLDGGGIADIGSADVVGWYSGTQQPTLVVPAASVGGLDFALPVAEIHGTVTFGAGQARAWLNFRPDTTCDVDGFRPTSDQAIPGPFAVIGLYPGTYCIRAEGDFPPTGWHTICYGDPLCMSPTPLTLGATQILTGIDIDFSVVTPTESTAWGAIKSAYR